MAESYTCNECFDRDRFEELCKKYNLNFCYLDEPILELFEIVFGDFFEK